jgi:hypothetical protein
VRETLPAEVVAAVVARHMVASTLLQDSDTAFRTVLCAHLLDPVDGLIVFLLRGFAAGSLGVPGAIASEAEFVLAVRTSDLLWCVCGCFVTAIFYGEVVAAPGGETGDEAGVRGEVALGKSGVIPDSD